MSEPEQTVAKSRYFIQLPEEVVRNKRLGLGPFRLYTLLLVYCRNKAYCWPSQTTLAEELGVTARTVRRWLQELEEQGVLYVSRRFDLASPFYEQTSLYYPLERVRREETFEEEIGADESLADDYAFVGSGEDFHN